MSKPTHWTYAEFSESADLFQGDILTPTEELGELFRTVHPHFCDNKYLGFVVTTQTCDLVRRKGVCDTQYINVAAVRSLSGVLGKCLDSCCTPVKSGVYIDRDRNRANDLLSRVINQNEWKLGLFYLYPDGAVGIGEDAVALLRVSVAFLARHYDIMCRARRGRLTPEFANKLGWLLGNLYSRVGTRDWPSAELGQMIRKLLDDEIRWVNERAVDELKRQKCEIESLTLEEFLQRCGEASPLPLKQVGIRRIVEIVADVVEGLDESRRKRLETRLANDSALSQTFRK